jgi:hypothetical protein
LGRKKTIIKRIDKITSSAERSRKHMVFGYEIKKK